MSTLVGVSRTLTWLKNAAVRTLHTALPKTARPDDAWARERMPANEYALYQALPPAERVHAVMVARCVESRAAARGLEAGVLVRAALLHDVGKLGTDNNVVWRVLSHLLGPSDAAAEPRLSSLAGTRQAARHHPAYGEALILAAGGDAEVARLVARHHDPRSDAAAELLKECDELA